MLWLYLHFPALQLDGLPATDRPRAVACDRRHRLLQLNAEAAEHGLKPGMGLAMASSLCRELEVLVYRPALGPRRLRELAHGLYHLTADISLFDPDGLALRADTMLRYYGTMARYWQQLSRQLSDEQVQVIPATGQRPLTARALARAGGGPVTDEPDNLEHNWRCVPLSASDLDGRTQEALARLGLRTLGELATVPTTELADRLDRDALIYVQRLTGQRAHPLASFVPPENFERHIELACESETLAPLAAPLERVLAQLASFLRQRDQVTDYLSLRLHLRRLAPEILTIHAGTGEARAEVWDRLLQLRLEKVTLAEPVYAFTLTAGSAYRRRAPNRDLFDTGGEHTTPDELKALLEARLGRGAVNHPLHPDDHRPEAEATAIPPDTPLAQRPSLLCDTPFATTEPLDIVQGPERIATGWWDRQIVMRDYYLARNRQGQWLWVFRPLEAPTGPWYIHGYFS